MPQVTDPIALKTAAAAAERGGPAAAAVASMGDLNPDDLDDDESDVDIN